jgi:hypothetical protein
MMMDPSNMDVYTREWWDHARMKILQKRRVAANGIGGVHASATGGGGGGAEWSFFDPPR